MLTLKYSILVCATKKIVIQLSYKYAQKSLRTIYFCHPKMHEEVIVLARRRL